MFFLNDCDVYLKAVIFNLWWQEIVGEIKEALRAGDGS